ILALDALVEVLGDPHHAGGASPVREARYAEKIDLHREFDVPGQGGEEESRPLQYADQLDGFALIILCDLGRKLAEAAVDLVFGEENPLDRRSGPAHTAIGRSASPYLNTRFSKSFW